MTQAFNLSQLANGVNTSGQLDIANYVTGTLPTANLPTIPVANGGTGQTTYTNGQLLIGNTTGNTLTKATLTAGSGISITNGNGSISIAASGGGGFTLLGSTGLSGNSSSISGLNLSSYTVLFYTMTNLSMGGTAYMNISSGNTTTQNSYYASSSATDNIIGWLALTGGATLMGGFSGPYASYTTGVSTSTTTIYCRISGGQNMVGGTWTLWGVK